MREYYRLVLRDALAIAFAHGNRGQTLIALALSALTAVNQPVGEVVSSGWGGISQWLALLPVGLLVLWSVGKANHERIVGVVERNRMIERSGSPLLQGLTNLWLRGGELRRRVERAPAQPHFDTLFDEVCEWNGHVVDMLERSAPELVDEFREAAGGIYVHVTDGHRQPIQGRDIRRHLVLALGWLRRTSDEIYADRALSR